MSPESSGVIAESDRGQSPPVSRSARLIIALLLVSAGAAWLFMNELVVFTNWAHKRATAPPRKELPEGLTPDEQLMYTLSYLGGSRAEEAVEQIVASGDKRFIPVLIEMLRANETLDFVGGGGAHKHIFALDKLAGVKIRPEGGGRYAELSSAWMKWYITTAYVPPPGYTTWKGTVFSKIDPIYGELLRDEHPTRIRAEEILFGGAQFDGIPALDTPRMIPALDGDYLEPDEPVFGVVVNGDARAYPQRILDWHEMVNDIVGGVPVSLSYCSLCGAAIAYDGRASNGKTYTFGTSGLLYRSNKLMYDRQSRTLWNQYTGRAVHGSLVPFDPRLEQIPVVVAEWRDWQSDHPETQVMHPDTGYTRRYQPGEPYGEYYESGSTMFPVAETNPQLPPKARVFGLKFSDAAKAYALDQLADAEVVNDTVGRQRVVIVATRDTVDVTGSVLLMGKYREGVEYDAGGEVRAYDRGERSFRPGPDDTSVVDSDGGLWRITEQSLQGPKGETIPRLYGIQSYWFAWSGFNEKTLVYSSELEDSSKPGD